MEQLQIMLRRYISAHLSDFVNSEWALQFCQNDFPSYWKNIYDISIQFPKNSRIIEIGCGYGFVLSIFLFHGFFSVKGYERDTIIAQSGNCLLNSIFGVDNAIIKEDYINQKNYADILILANCVYTDFCKDKRDYMQRIKTFYLCCGSPKYMILEVIDSSYVQEDTDFPMFVRLNQQEIQQLFPFSKISYWQTSIFPNNKRSKTLYLIESI